MLQNVMEFVTVPFQMRVEKHVQMKMRRTAQSLVMKMRFRLTVHQVTMGAEENVMSIDMKCYHMMTHVANVGMAQFSMDHHVLMSQDALAQSMEL